LIPLLTYDGLVDYMTKISARPNDNDLIAQMPNFILLAQIDLSRKLNIFGTQKILTGTWPDQQSTIQLPNLYVRPISLTFYDPTNSNQAHVLTFRLNEYAQRVTSTNEVTGIPSDYSELDVNTIFVTPRPKSIAPFAGFGFQLIFHELYQALSPINQSNYFTQRMMDLLSYGALLQMYIYLKDSYYMNFYMQMLEKGISAATNQDQMNQTDRAAQSSIN
jgi:hypothetical protein